MAPFGKPIMDTSKMAAAQRRRRQREKNGVLVDPKCVDLAKHFLSDYQGKPEDAVALAESLLAQTIQLCVEDFLADTFDNLAPPGRAER